MRSAVSLLMMTVAGATVTPIVAQDAGANLNGTYAVRVGDITSMMLSEFLKIRTDLSDPAIVTYEPDNGVIDVEIFAAPSSFGSKTDKARQVIGQYWDFIQQGLFPYAERRFGVHLSAQNFRIVYYDRNAEGGPAAVMSFINGTYTLP